MACYDKIIPSMEPTSHFRWRTVAATESDAEKGIRRSTLEQLWVDDRRTYGEWRRVPQVDQDAAVEVPGRFLPDVL